jgi:signal peptidase I
VPRIALGLVPLPVDTNQPCEMGDLMRYRGVEADGTATCRVPVYRETLPNGVSYNTLDLGADSYNPADNFGPVRVPEGNLFLMGDNREMSADSRFSLDEGGLGGPVPIASISGRAELITHSYDGSGSWFNPLTWVTTLRSNRAGTSLHPDKTAAE